MRGLCNLEKPSDRFIVYRSALRCPGGKIALSSATMLHTTASLVRQLHALGLHREAIVMVHASLRKLGPIEGGADELLDALLHVIGPEGTLLMAFGAQEDQPFDADSTPVAEDIGVLAEVFRNRPGTLVNDHAAARFGVTGKHASELLDVNLLHDYYGRGSILERFTNLGGVVLRLGADVDTVTLTHFAEYLADVPNKRRVHRRYERADSGEQWIESLDDTDGVFEWEPGDYFSQILLDYLAAGRANIAEVGSCTAELLVAKGFVSFAVEWMEKNL